MAKQSGLHQIRGKVGEHSYYRQTGVSAGLIRSINQGLSSRVKTGAEYVNTRLNNAEFGQACTIAAHLISYITPKYRPMILPFSQAKLAKLVLELIKQDSADWGTRNLTDADGSKVAPLVSALAKNNFEEYGVTISGGDDKLTVNVDDVIGNAKLQDLGADSYMVRVITTDTWIGKFLAGAGKYVMSSAHSEIYDVDLGGFPTSEEIDAVYPADPTVPTLQSGCRNVFVIVMPYRTINNKRYVLQEACTFKAFAEIAMGD